MGCIYSSKNGLSQLCTVNISTILTASSTTWSLSNRRGIQSSDLTSLPIRVGLGCSQNRSSELNVFTIDAHRYLLSIN
jgi:hypothetical protein